LGNRS